MVLATRKSVAEKRVREGWEMLICLAIRILRSFLSIPLVTLEVDLDLITREHMGRTFLVVGVDVVALRVASYLSKG